MATHGALAQDILAHFALREAEPDSLLDVEGFWKLAQARGPIDEASYAKALQELMVGGYIYHRGESFFLSAQGYEHIHGRPPT